MSYRLKDFGLEGKNAIVTGVSRTRGIGAAVSLALAEAGVNLFTSYYRPYDRLMPWGSEAGEAGEILKQIKAFDVKADSVELDLADPDCAPGLFDRAEAFLGPVDIIVNGATYSVNDGIQNLTAESLDKHYAVNIRGTFLLCAEFVKRWKKKEGGRIINFTSGISKGPMSGELAYSATKAAVEGFTLSLSAEAAPLGITVNALNPGPTDNGWMSREARKWITDRTPAGRPGAPEDAARLARFLASPQSAWITGQVIHSDGGFH